MKKILAVPILCAVGLSAPAVTYANSFREAGVDTTTSVGKFKIKLTDEYAEMLGVREIVSPRLFDAQTKIGRSRPRFDGSRADEIEGAIICENGSRTACSRFIPEYIRDIDFAHVPNGDNELFQEGPRGTREIHVRILSLNLIDTGECGTKSANAIRTGSIAPDVPRSLGEVESLNPPGSFEGYPAEGFFNLFVEVDVDWNNDGTVDATLFNNYPIVIQDSYPDAFPGNVVYVHDSSDFAVPVYEKADSTHVGWIIIAGQDIGSSCGGYGVDERIFDKPPLSVELSSFTATGSENGVSLGWETETEINCDGYHLWRAKKNEAGEYVEITKLTEQLIPSEGGVFDEAIYSYDDSGVMPGNLYYYGLEDVTNDDVGTIHLESIISTTIGGKTEY